MGELKYILSVIFIFLTFARGEAQSEYGDSPISIEMLSCSADAVSSITIHARKDASNVHNLSYRLFYFAPTPLSPFYRCSKWRTWTTSPYSASLLNYIHHGGDLRSSGKGDEPYSFEAPASPGIRAKLAEIQRLFAMNLTVPDIPVIHGEIWGTDHERIHQKEPTENFINQSYIARMYTIICVDAPDFKKDAEAIPI